MRIRTRVGAALLVAALLVIRLPAQQAPVFRAGVDVVTVDVSVRRGNVPVAGLAATDFLVTDNGVRQQVEVVPTTTMPVNLSLLVDTSGSVYSIADSLASQVTEAVALLRADDQFRLIAFSAGATQVLPMQPARAPVKIDRVSAGGGTSLYDALAAALIRRRTPERGEMVVAFSDGLDTTSALGLDHLRDVARRSEAVLYLYILRTPQFARMCMPESKERQDRLLDPDRPTGGNVMLNERDIPTECDQSGLSKLADATGGRVRTVSAGAHLPEGLRTALDEFRTSYVLTYTPKGVMRAGWHDLAVKITRAGKFDVHARRGYFGS